VMTKSKGSDAAADRATGGVHQGSVCTGVPANPRILFVPGAGS
jgi:hypothetical protein